MLLTLFSLVLTVAVGGIFLVGLHRVVQWAVLRIERRGTRVDIEVEDHHLTSR